MLAAAEGTNSGTSSLVIEAQAGAAGGGDDCGVQRMTDENMFIDGLPPSGPVASAEGDSSDAMGLFVGGANTAAGAHVVAAPAASSLSLPPSIPAEAPAAEESVRLAGASPRLPESPGKDPLPDTHALALLRGTRPNEDATAAPGILKHEDNEHHQQHQHNQQLSGLEADIEGDMSADVGADDEPAGVSGGGGVDSSATQQHRINSAAAAAAAAGTATATAAAGSEDGLFERDVSVPGASADISDVDAELVKADAEGVDDGDVDVDEGEQQQLTEDAAHRLRYLGAGAYRLPLGALPLFPSPQVSAAAHEPTVITLWYHLAGDSPGAPLRQHPAALRVYTYEHRKTVHLTRMAALSGRVEGVDAPSTGSVLGLWGLDDGRLMVGPVEPLLGPERLHWQPPKAKGGARTSHNGSVGVAWGPSMPPGAAQQQRRAPLLVPRDRSSAAQQRQGGGGGGGRSSADGSAGVSAGGVSSALVGSGRWPQQPLYPDGGEGPAPDWQATARGPYRLTAFGSGTFGLPLSALAVFPATSVSAAATQPTAVALWYQSTLAPDAPLHRYDAALRVYNYEHRRVSHLTRMKALSDTIVGGAPTTGGVLCLWRLADSRLVVSVAEGAVGPSGRGSAASARGGGAAAGSGATSRRGAAANKGGRGSRSSVTASAAAATASATAGLTDLPGAWEEEFPEEVGWVGGGGGGSDRGGGGGGGRGGDVLTGFYRSASVDAPGDPDADMHNDAYGDAADDEYGDEYGAGGVMGPQVLWWNGNGLYLPRDTANLLGSSIRAAATAESVALTLWYRPVDDAGPVAPLRRFTRSKLRVSPSGSATIAGASEMVKDVIGDEWDGAAKRLEMWLWRLADGRPAITPVRAPAPTAPPPSQQQQQQQQVPRRAHAQPQFVAQHQQHQQHQQQRSTQYLQQKLQQGPVPSRPPLHRQQQRVPQQQQQAAQPQTTRPPRPHQPPPYLPDRQSQQQLAAGKGQGWAGPRGSGTAGPLTAATITSTYTHLPAASIGHLHGYLPPGASLPQLRPGELRLCGLTFHPDLAPRVRQTMEDWEAATVARLREEGRGEGLEDAYPTLDQISIPGADVDDPDSKAGGIDPITGMATAISMQPTPGSQIFHQYGLSNDLICSGMATLLGITVERGWDAPLPGEGPLELSQALVEPCEDAARGGAGLRAVRRIARSSVLGVVGGYVLSPEAAKSFTLQGFRHCSAAIRSQMEAEVAAVGLPTVAPAWQVLAGAFRVPVPGLEAEPVMNGARGDAAGSGFSRPLEVSMLAYGNMAALINDPRVEPRAWVEGNDVDDEDGVAEASANCAVLPVSVRGLVLPVLVATRNIVPGEQLLRDYGAAWWRELAQPWQVLSVATEVAEEARAAHTGAEDDDNGGAGDHPRQWQMAAEQEDGPDAATWQWNHEPDARRHNTTYVSADNGKRHHPSGSRSVSPVSQRRCV